MRVGYSKQAVGIHTLEKYLKEIFAEAGVPGYFTLHCLRASCASRLYQAGVQEQQIMEITGHVSNAVREYKRTSDEMRENCSEILNGTKKLKTEELNVSTKKEEITKINDNDGKKSISVTLNFNFSI